MHDSQDTPTLDVAQARWDAANEAVKVHAKRGRRNDAIPPEDEGERAAWDAEHAAWVEEWERVQAEARAAVVELYRARQAAGE
jgi:hypothetical protein